MISQIPKKFWRAVHEIISSRLKHPARLISIRPVCHQAWRKIGYDLDNVTTSMFDGGYTIVCEVCEMYGGVLSDLTAHDRTMGTARRKGSKSEWGNACKIYRFPPLKERKK